MAYGRRYFSPFTLPTDALKDKAVTEDKIAPGAVGTEELADQGVETEDIKDGAVTGPKIANNAVSTGKIQDGAVTQGKLAVAVPTRPFSPAISTAEIADGAVTAPKMSAGVMTTDKIADGAVTNPKIASNAIDQTKIAANAVTGTEIANGAVGATELSTNAVETAKIKDGAVTAPKIATDAVETLKIKDGAVTAPKIATDAVETLKIKNLNVTTEKLNVDALAIRLFASFLRRNFFFHDDFFGAALLPIWVPSGGGSADTSFDAQCGGLAISTPFGTTEDVNWNSHKNIYLGYTVDVETTIMFGLDSVPGAAGDYLTWRLTMLIDGNNYVEFKASDNAGNKPTWHARCVSGGVASDVDTGVEIEAGTGEIQHLRIEYTTTEVKFYIDNVLEATINANIPTGAAEVQFELTNNHGADDRYLNIVYASLMGNRIRP